MQIFGRRAPCFSSSYCSRDTPILVMMLALSIRQPFAELILRGLKTIEYRSRSTRIIGERFHIYASMAGWIPKASSIGHAKIWSKDLNVAVPPPWMAELAQLLILLGPDGGALPRGVIVGSAIIAKVTPGDPALGSGGMFHWHLADVQREPVPHKPTGHPQPVWWRPG